MIIYTATFGRTLAPQKRWANHDMFCFSDVKPPYPWHWVKIEPVGDPVRAARHIKILPWEYFDIEWDSILWLDANMALKQDPETMPGPLAIHTHRDRDCLFAEAEKCITSQKDNPELLLNQIQAYEEHPEHWGLWETQLVYRENTPAIRAFCEDWWAELEQHSKRDQVSLPWVLRKHNILPESLGNNAWKSRWARRYAKSKQEESRQAILGRTIRKR